MMIKNGNMTQTHEVVRVFGFEPHVFQSTHGGFETGKNRSEPRIEWSWWGRFIYEWCVEKTSLSGIVAFKKFTKSGGWFSDKWLRCKIMVEIFTIYWFGVTHRVYDRRRRREYWQINSGENWEIIRWRDRQHWHVVGDSETDDIVSRSRVFCSMCVAA